MATESSVKYDPVISGSSYIFPLNKKIISNQRAKDQLSTDFTEIAISEEEFDNEKIKQIYNDVFFQIPKRGEESHESIVIQSTDLVYPEENENLETSIKIAENDLLELNESASFASLPPIPLEHPVFANGFLVQEGDPILNIPIEPGSDIWYIQQGMKRKLGRSSSTGDVNGYWHRLLRQAQGEIVFSDDGVSYKNLKDSPYFQYLTPEELNSIPDGEPINHGYDLSIDPLLGIEPQYIYSEITLELTCKGVEKFYKFRYGEPGHDYDLSEYEHGGTKGGYWWVDTDAGCRARIQTDIDPSTTFKSSTWDFTWKGKKTVTISRDAIFYNNHKGINGSTDPLDSAFYNPSPADVLKENQWSAGPKMRVWKKWGDDSLFPAIRSMGNGSRVTYKMKSPYNQDANGNSQIVDAGGEGPSDTGGLSHWMYGIDDGNDQEGVLNSYYTKNSNWGTRMLNPSNCYGPLSFEGCHGSGKEFETHDWLKPYLNGASDNYYRTSVSTKQKTYFSRVKVDERTITQPVYGQPIIQVRKTSDDYYHFCVFLEAYRVEAYVGHWDWNVFYDLETGSAFKVLNKHLDDCVQGYKAYDNDLFCWLDRDQRGGKINNPTIFFPGLKGRSINYENTDVDNRTTLGGLDQFFEDLEQWIQGTINNAIQGYIPGMPAINFIGDQMRDNPWNPSNGGSDYVYTMKNALKRTPVSA